MSKINRTSLKVSLSLAAVSILAAAGVQASTNAGWVVAEATAVAPHAAASVAVDASVAAPAVEKAVEGKCKTGKCGAGKKDHKEHKAKEGKCKAGKCGAGKKEHKAEHDAHHAAEPATPTAPAVK